MSDTFLKDGDVRFVRGCDSYSAVETLGDEGYAWGVNVINRGGAVRARPGFDTVANLPDGKLQAFTTFVPLRGLPQLIAVVDGVVYGCHYPYKAFVRISGATMSRRARRVFVEQAVKSVERNADQSLTLISPRSVLVFQDGLGVPTYYDGSVIKMTSGDWPVPVGTAMKWTGSRLWVGRDDQVFASDIADPVCFYEQQYNTLGGISYYTLPGAITAFGVAPGNQIPGVIAFTARTMTVFRSDVTTRSQWESLADFRRTIFNGLGCVAPFSVTEYAGQLIWYSEQGLANLDMAEATWSSTKYKTFDNEMARSKARLSPDLSGVCAVAHDNFLLVSVPNASIYNRHTWVMDVDPLATQTGDAPPTWAGIWTGLQPVQWVVANLWGTSRVFCASVDADGHNRVYEAFKQEGRDNGVDLPWRFESRGYRFESDRLKKFRHAVYSLSGLRGKVDLAFKWAGGGRGRWKDLGTQRFWSAEGGINADTEYSATDVLVGLKSQSRVGRTMDTLEQSEDSQSSAGVEGPVFSHDENQELVDQHFQICIEGSGPCALRALRVMADDVQEKLVGQPPSNESAPGYVREDGGASDNVDDLAVPVPSFTSTATATASYEDQSFSATATVTSYISQLDADKRAEQHAESKAEKLLEAAEIKI